MILVTGATGFVGKHLVKRLLKEGYEVRCLVRDVKKAKTLGDKIDIWIGDITDKNSLKGICKGIDIVFHLASLMGGNIWGYKKERYWKVNFEGTKNLIEECVHEKVKKFIYFSSIAAMGLIEKNSPIDENDKCMPESLYGITEYEAEKLLFKYQKKFDINVTVFRPTWIYSDIDRKEPWRFKKSIKIGVIPILEDRSCIRDLIHIDDVIEAAILSLNRRDKKEIYIICGKAYLWSDIVDYAIKKYGKPGLKINIPETFYNIFSFLWEDIFSILNRESYYFNSRKINYIKSKMRYNGEKAYKCLGFLAKKDFFSY